MSQNFVNRLAGLAAGNGAGNVVESAEARAARIAEENAALNAMFAAKKKGKKSKKGAAAVDANLFVAPENRPRTLLDIITNGRFPQLELFFTHNPDFDVRSFVPVPDTERSEPLLIHVLINYNKGNPGAYERMVAFLLARGAEANKPSSNDVLPIFYGILTRNTTIVQQLLAAGADINKRSEVRGVNATGYANTNQRNNIENNRNNNPLNRIQINNVNYNNSRLPLTPIQLAIKGQEWEIVKELLRRGARIDINKPFPSPFTQTVNDNDYEPMLDLPEMTLLMTAIGLDDEDLFNLCIERGADVNVFPEGAIPPLFLATGMARLSMLQTLVERGADIAATIGDRNLGYYARASRDPVIINRIRELGVNVENEPQENIIPLHMEAPEPIPAPNPVLEYPEYEDYPSEELPIISIPPIPNETEVFDVVMSMDTPFQEVFEDEDNIIFRYKIKDVEKGANNNGANNNGANNNGANNNGANNNRANNNRANNNGANNNRANNNRANNNGANNNRANTPKYNYFSFPRSEILKSLSKNEQLRFPCNIVTEGPPYKNQVDMGTIYFIIAGPNRYTVPLEHIVGWIHNPAIRILDILETDETSGTMTSWHSIVDEYTGGETIGLGGQAVIVTSAEHCNPGTEKRIYNLAILQMGGGGAAAAAAAEGGRRRTRKRKVPRRRKTHKRRHQKTHRKQKKIGKKRLHRTKKRSTK